MPGTRKLGRSTDQDVYKRQVVDAQALIDAGLLKKTLDGVKVLGRGEITKKLTVNVAAFSASAKQKIEAAGGKAEVM